MAYTVHSHGRCVTKWAWVCSHLDCRLSLSLHFNGHFPGEPRLAGVHWSKGQWRWRWQLDYWSCKSCKAPVKSSPPTNQHPVFLQAGCPFCRPPNSVKALKGKISHSMDLLTPSSPGGLPTLSLTTNSSWLPWGRVTMPLISPLMPVPRVTWTVDYCWKFCHAGTVTEYLVLKLFENWSILSFFINYEF